MDKKKKKMPLWVVLVWFTSFSLNCILLFLKFEKGYRTEGLMVMDILATLFILFAFLATLWRWKRDKDDPDKA